MAKHKRRLLSQTGILQYCHGLLLLVASMLPSLAYAQAPLLTFTATLERVGHGSKALPSGLQPGVVVPGSIELEDKSVPLNFNDSEAGLVKLTRTFPGSSVRITLGAPLHARFEGLQINQADGMLSFSADPICPVEFSLLTPFRPSGQGIGGASGADYSPSRLVLMQRGHDDMNQALETIFRSMGEQARMLVQYGLPEEKSDSISLVFNLAGIRLQSPTASD